MAPVTLKPRLAASAMPPATLHWTSDRRELPSEYTISIKGQLLTCFLVKKSEARSDSLFRFIKGKTGSGVRAVGVAAGHGEAIYPVKTKVINAPMYHKGNLRAQGVDALWAECEAACSQNQVIVVHCNESFHRGPLLLAAMMVKAGKTLSQALQYIGTKRNIYSGHFMEHSEWPKKERESHHAKDLLEAHRFVRGLEPVCGLQPGAVASGLQPGAADSSTGNQNVMVEHSQHATERDDANSECVVVDGVRIRARALTLEDKEGMRAHKSQKSAASNSSCSIPPPSYKDILARTEKSSSSSQAGSGLQPGPHVSSQEQMLAHKMKQEPAGGSKKESLQTAKEDDDTSGSHPESTPAAATNAKPVSTPAAGGLQPDSTPKREEGLQPEAAVAQERTPVAATGAQPVSTPPETGGAQEESAIKAEEKEGLQPEMAVAPEDVNYDPPTDDEKSSVWTDEEEHEAWRSMSIEDRFKHVKVMKRKLAWYASQQEEDLQSGLQPGAQNENLPRDIITFLEEHQLRHLSHLSVIKGFFEQAILL